MKKIIFIYTILLSTVSLAQEVKYDSDDEVEEKSQFKRTSFTDWRSRSYFSISNSLLIDYVTSPLAYYNPQLTQPSFAYDRAATQTQMSSVYSLGVEARYNLIDIKENLALAVSVPFSFGFGQAYASSEQTLGGSGFGSVQIPVMARMLFGAGSTFDAQDDFGVNIGAGYEFNKLGVFNFNTIIADPNINKSWIMPNVMVGVTFIRGLSPIEVNLKYGFGPIQEQFIDGEGNRMTNKRTTRATSLKLTLLYPLN